jgi:predicted PurR-regulated permease PerM
MEPNSKPGRITAFSLGALAGVLLAAFSVLMRRWQRPAVEAIDMSSQPTPASPSLPRVDNRPSPAPAGTPAGIPAGLPAGLPASPTTTIESAPRWTTPTKYIVGVVLFLSAMLVLFVGRMAIPMVITGALLALFINPVIQYLNRLLRGRWAQAVILTYLLVILLLVAVVLLVIPNLLGAIEFILSIDFQQLAADMAQSVAQVRLIMEGNPLLASTLGSLLASLEVNLGNFASEAQLPSGATDINLTNLLPRLAGIVSPVISLLVSMLFTLLIALQMSLAAPGMSGWYPDLIPPAYKPELSALGGEITQTWISFLRGQLSLMLIIGLAVWLANTILGVPQALFLGVLAGVLELIPSIGPTLAAIPAVALALLFGSTHFDIGNVPFALLVIGVYVLIQFIENQFLVPYVMGDAVDLPPLVVLIGALAGALAFGILGALLATPVIATGNLIFRYTYRKILEPAPLPPPPEEEPSMWEKVKGWAGRIRLPRRKNP